MLALPSQLFLVKTSHLLVSSIRGDWIRARLQGPIRSEFRRCLATRTDLSWEKRSGQHIIYGEVTRAPYYNRLYGVLVGGRVASFNVSAAHYYVYIYKDMAYSLIGAKTLKTQQLSPTLASKCSSNGIFASKYEGTTVPERILDLSWVRAA